MDDNQLLALIRASERRRSDIRRLGTFIVVMTATPCVILLAHKRFGAPLFLLLAGLVISLVAMTIALVQARPPAGSLEPKILAKRVDELQARFRRQFLAFPLVQLGMSFSVIHATSSILTSGIQGPFDVVTLLAWVALTGLQGLVLGSNGFARKFRLALDDELFKYHRSQAARTGFYACLASSLIVFAVGLANPVMAISLLPALVGLAIAIAAIHFIYLDWQAEIDG